VARRGSGAGHGMDKDPFELEADIDATRELVKIVGLKLAEVFVYSGDRHLCRQLAYRRTTPTWRRWVPRSRVPQPGGLLRTTTRRLFRASTVPTRYGDHTRLAAHSSPTLQRNVRTSCMTQSTPSWKACADSPDLGASTGKLPRSRNRADRRLFARLPTHCRSRSAIGVVSKIISRMPGLTSRGRRPSKQTACCPQRGAQRTSRTTAVVSAYSGSEIVRRIFSAAGGAPSGGCLWSWRMSGPGPVGVRGPRWLGGVRLACGAGAAGRSWGEAVREPGA
jgi:hypothetical protein